MTDEAALAEQCSQPKICAPLQAPKDDKPDQEPSKLRCTLSLYLSPWLDGLTYLGMCTPPLAALRVDMWVRLYGRVWLVCRGLLT